MFGLNSWLLGGVAAAFIATAAWGGWQAWDAAEERAGRIAAEGKAAQLQADLNTAVAGNRQLSATIDDMEKQATVNDRLVADLQKQLNSSHESTLAMAQRIAALRKDNPDVQDFLNLPLPDALLGVYNGGR